jgi:hypothetical protein
VSSLDSGDVQLVMLALAQLALRRPGWDYALRQLAEKIEPVIGPGLYDEFKSIHARQASHG